MTPKPATVSTAVAIMAVLKSFDKYKNITSLPDCPKEVKLGIVQAQLSFAKMLVLRLEKDRDVLEGKTELTDAEVNMLRQGQKIPAIKSVRERLNYGLLEAKLLVEKEGERLGVYVPPRY